MEFREANYADVLAEQGGYDVIYCSFMPQGKNYTHAFIEKQPGIIVHVIGTGGDGKFVTGLDSLKDSGDTHIEAGWKNYGSAYGLAALNREAARKGLKQYLTVDQWDVNPLIGSKALLRIDARADLRAR